MCPIEDKNLIIPSTDEENVSVKIQNAFLIKLLKLEREVNFLNITVNGERLNAFPWDW